MVRVRVRVRVRVLTLILTRCRIRPRVNLEKQYTHVNKGHHAICFKLRLGTV